MAERWRVLVVKSWKDVGGTKLGEVYLVDRASIVDRGTSGREWMAWAVEKHGTGVLAEFCKATHAVMFVEALARAGEKIARAKVAA